MNHAATDEAKAVRAQRRALDAAQAEDPLRERARLVAFWRLCAVSNPRYAPHNGAWWHTFTWQPCWRWLVMPKLRARLDARDKARRDRHRADLRADAQRLAQVKAERAAAKLRSKSAQGQLLSEPAE